MSSGVGSHIRDEFCISQPQKRLGLSSWLRGHHATKTCIPGSGNGGTNVLLVKPGMDKDGMSHKRLQ